MCHVTVTVTCGRLEHHRPNLSLNSTPLQALCRNIAQSMLYTLRVIRCADKNRWLEFLDVCMRVNIVNLQPCD